MRFATDTGGTFTDLVIEEEDGELSMYKAATTPDDPVSGVLNALRLAAEDRGLSLSAMLERGETFIHGTTHSINAIITGNTARTAFVTTAGHGDILGIREGGRIEPFNNTVPYPKPFIPRALTYELDERVLYSGEILKPLSDDQVITLAAQLREEQVEAIAVCLLWSFVNGTHELRVGEIFEEHLPGIPITLSHQLNPALREYRRASSAAIDASLKPLMSKYMGGLSNRLREAGFAGRILVLTSSGGMVDGDELAAKPILSLNSGPSMAPNAGRYYASLEGCSEHDVIVADTGGTTYDISLVRSGRIPVTREMWIGQQYRGHLTGFPSIDVMSVGAGGGSIAWVDAGGVLHVGPQSAGSVPGPACYKRGGKSPTLTDACVVLGYVDPDYFLGGRMTLSRTLAEGAISVIAEQLAISLQAAAAAVVDLATENMVQAIAEITVNQGIDPTQAVLIGGGGAAGLNSVFIQERLGCQKLIFPETGSTLSAAGAMMSQLANEFARTHFTDTSSFDFEGVNKTIRELLAKCDDFIAGPGRESIGSSIELVVESRYRDQVWELDLPVSIEKFRSDEDVALIRKDFDRLHGKIFAIEDTESDVEFVSWRAVVRCKLKDTCQMRLTSDSAKGREEQKRKIYFSRSGWVPAKVSDYESLKPGEVLLGPAIVESPFTTVVVSPDASFEKTTAGNLVIQLIAGI